MPKIIEYPSASFKKSLDVAKTVDELGGSCDKKTCADKMGKKVGGGFLSLLAAASKYGFVKMTKGVLYLDQTYKNYKLAYNDQEKIEELRKAFFSVPLFKKIYEKYKDVKLPADLLDKVLIREYGLDEKIASRVAGYFIEAAKQVKVLNPDNTFNEITGKADEGSGEGRKSRESTESGQEEQEFPDSNNYTVTIRGPKINQTIEIEEVDHLLLVEAAIKLIRKKLSVPEDEENTKSTD